LVGQDRAASARHNRRGLLVGGAALLLVIAWFSFARPPGAGPSTHATGTPTPTGTQAQVVASPPPPVFTVATIWVKGVQRTLDAYFEPGEGVCLDLPTEGMPYCALARGPGPLRLILANWVYPGACCDFAMFVVGTIGPSVSSVRLSLGAGRWVDATIADFPASLNTGGLRLFYVDQRTGMQSLNHRLPIVALDAQRREIGRTTYLVLGG
jgi:hypothetical protein